MIFKQLFDQKSSTYTYLIASAKGREALIIDPVIENVNQYVQLLKEDLVIIRFVPKDGPVPEYKTGQFITLGLPNPTEGGKIVRRAYSIASR